MKICEVCGAKEQVEEMLPQATIEMISLHVCENCREDRKWHTSEKMEF